MWYHSCNLSFLPPIKAKDTRIELIITEKFSRIVVFRKSVKTPANTQTTKSFFVFISNANNPINIAGKAKSKKITPAEMDGSTFTISNLGMFGIQEFTSIINQPNSAILSVGAIVQRPVVKNGQIVVGNMMKLTLACDHRSVDGATGSKFLQTLQQYIENPLTMLL